LHVWITALVDAVKDLGKVVVIAPDKAQSGMGRNHYWLPVKNGGV